MIKSLYSGHTILLFFHDFIDFKGDSGMGLDGYHHILLDGVFLLKERAEICALIEMLKFSRCI